MRLFLVRHGETVDNVAGVYAGTRDSPLTAHGVLQARRLGVHLASRSGSIGPVTHLFSSDLRRAVETAESILAAQTQPAPLLPGTSGAAVADGGADGTPNLKLVQLPELRERDFGSAEGEKFGVSVTDAETREQMRTRVERFVKRHLAPLFEQHADTSASVVVVAHGLILDSLLRVLLARFGPAELVGEKRTAVWSNTGYVEAVIRIRSPSTTEVDEAEASSSLAARAEAATSGERTSQPRITLAIVGVNMLKHLEGLKKTRGGIGSAQFDKRQRTVDSFFGPVSKKARVEPKSEET
ncbi:hypothetical protein N0V88_000673 [Collariella sp. IMI 366227]|nr:hypothetical protein N0V88_000673 [Collariella sp. IMI 366227]